MADAATRDVRKIFLATLKEMEVFIAGRASLPEGNVACAGLTAAIEQCSISLGQQYETGASKAEGLPTEHLRLFNLYRSLADVPKAKDVVKIILENEMQNYINVELQQCDGTEAAECRQGLFTIWRSLQSEPTDKVALENAVLTAFFSRNSTVDLKCGFDAEQYGTSA
ncbi:MAG: hypothetical protein Q9193_004599 [Seirophora villosa]